MPLLVKAFIVFSICVGALGVGLAFADAPATVSVQNRNAENLLADGIELERERRWIDAIQHYEAAHRVFPDDAELRRRLLISRLHYDVMRRTSDSTIQNIVAKVSSTEALELYSEVLARLEMSYVEHLQMTEIIRGGTAYLEVALTEPGFVSSYARGVSADNIEQFRTSIHRMTLSQKVSNRFEARDIVANAAVAAERSLGIPQTATIMQFVFGAVGLLDPYSSFLSAAELNEVESQIEGNFVGLGIALQPHEVPLRILNVIPGGPAKEGGLLAGDRILEIGTTACTEVGAERAADLLRGPEQSHVRLLVQRADGSKVDKVFVRRRVEVPSVENAHLIEATTGIGYLKISSFQKTTAAELDQALWSLHKAGMQSLIIDLRGNPGGWLDAAVAVADRFLSEGTIVSTRGKNGIENQNYTASRNGTWQVPLVIMIDDQSASASEILAGAIRDNRRGKIVGETSYGKGSVQGLFHTKMLASGLRLTVSKFYSPSGRAISEQGVQPTVVVNDEAAHFVAKPIIGENAVSSGEPTQPADRVLAVAIEEARTTDLTARYSR